jgi:hypothetical protein
MNGTLEKVGDFLLPHRYRPYFTFRWMTVFVFLGAILNAAMKLTMKVPPDVVARFHEQEKWIRGPFYLVLVNLGIAAVLVLIYATRKRERYYFVRVFVYGMLLGGICVEVLTFIPFRT